MIDGQMLIITYMLIIVYHYKCCTCATLWCILHAVALVNVADGQEEASMDMVEEPQPGTLSMELMYPN